MRLGLALRPFINFDEIRGLLGMTIKNLMYVFVLLFNILPAHVFGDVKSERDSVETKYLVDAKVLFDEVSNIDISKGHYRVSVELLLAWEGDTDLFLNKFGDEVIHGSKLESFFEKIWFPEFFISNAENPRTTHYRTLGVFEDKYELVERFVADLSIDAEMPKYPFGTLDLFMDVASFSGNTKKMIFNPVFIEVGHHDVSRKVLKGNWSVQNKKLEEQRRTSLNQGGKEKFSYLISHVNVEHGFIDAVQKIFFPIISIILLSLLINHFYVLKAQEELYAMRVSGQLLLFLTLPGLKFALAGELPATHYLNLTDAFFIVATLIVTFNMLMGIVSHYYLSELNEQLEAKYATVIRVAGPLFAFVIFLVFISIIFSA